MNKVQEAMDYYDDLEHYIKDAYLDVYGEECEYGVFHAISKLAKSAKFEKMHHELVMSNIRNSEVLTGNILKLALSGALVVNQEKK